MMSLKLAALTLLVGTAVSKAIEPREAPVVVDIETTVILEDCDEPTTIIRAQAALPVTPELPWTSTSIQTLTSCAPDVIDCPDHIRFPVSIPPLPSTSRATSTIVVCPGEGCVKTASAPPPPPAPPSSAAPAPASVPTPSPIPSQIRTPSIITTQSARPVTAVPTTSSPPPPPPRTIPAPVTTAAVPIGGAGQLRSGVALGLVSILAALILA
jgi:hypothetical protein